MDHGHKSLVKRQHSTRRRCIGLEGAVNTTASSVPLKHEPRGEGAAAAKRREPGELGPMPSAAEVPTVSAGATPWPFLCGDHCCHWETLKGLAALRARCSATPPG